MPDFLIDKLNLFPHPEGGHFSRTYISKGIINKKCSIPSKKYVKF